MELYFGENGDQRIRGDFIRRAVLRSDLVPIPLTLEAEIRVGTETAAEFDVGRSITTYDGDELEIIKSEHVQQARMQGDDLSGYVRLIATLKPVTPVAFIKPRAVIKHGASLTEVYRACGATLRGIEGDFPVPRFVCLAGEAHTYHIARALQEAGGVPLARLPEPARSSRAASLRPSPKPEPGGLDQEQKRCQDREGQQKGALIGGPRHAAASAHDGGAVK